MNSSFSLKSLIHNIIGLRSYMGGKWIFTLIFGYGLNLFKKRTFRCLFVKLKNDTYKGRNRTNEARKDNQILVAKVKYLESNKDNRAIDYLFITSKRNLF